MAAEGIDDRNVRAIGRLDPPRELRRKLPLGATAQDCVSETRAAIRRLLAGTGDRRLLIVVGPCSIHDPDAAFEYATRLRAVRDRVSDALLVVMRTYFEKPRTTVGWKGLLNDPHLDGSCDVAAGVSIARELLLSILSSGLPCGGEILDPISPQYLADLYAWAAIGARTAESQTHREIVSGVSMPVGFKNGTDGSLEAASNAIIAARAPHAFLGIDLEGRASVVETSGNADCHVVLRGGRAGTNFGAADIRRAAELAGHPGRAVMVDCSHGNSGKDFREQPRVARAVLAERAAADHLLGFMLESNLAEGNQVWQPGAALQRGLSITDACIGWEETEALLDEIAETVRFSRG
jgi:3-deoxy-7-phosphoheptulonate synthase